MNSNTTNQKPDGAPLTTAEHTEAHADKVKGYRKLSDAEIESINELKAMGGQVGRKIEALEKLEGIDRRWLAIAKTDFQTGLMAAVRAVAQPNSF